MYTPLSNPLCGLHSVYNLIEVISSWTEQKLRSILKYSFFLLQYCNGTCFHHTYTLFHSQQLKHSGNSSPQLFSVPFFFVITFWNKLVNLELLVEIMMYSNITCFILENWPQFLNFTYLEVIHNYPVLLLILIKLFSSFNWLWRALQVQTNVVFLVISSISYGFHVKLDSSKIDGGRNPCLLAVVISWCFPPESE